MFLSPSMKVLKLPSTKIKRHGRVKRTSIIWHNEHKIFFIHFDFIFLFSSMKIQCYQAMDLFGTNFLGNF